MKQPLTAILLVGASVLHGCSFDRRDSEGQEVVRLIKENGTVQNDLYVHVIEKEGITYKYEVPVSEPNHLTVTLINYNSEKLVQMRDDNLDLKVDSGVGANYRLPNGLYNLHPTDEKYRPLTIDGAYTLHPSDGNKDLTKAIEILRETLY